MIVGRFAAWMISSVSMGFSVTIIRGIESQRSAPFPVAFDCDVDKFIQEALLRRRNLTTEMAAWPSPAKASI
jgi:hypothetical protein